MTKLAILSFPGNNGDVENVRTMKRCGFDPFVFRWNDDKEKLKDVSAYFIGAGFSYEDRGRAGLVAGRDPLFAFLHEEAAKGKVIVGHCNGCQMLVESELIPLGNELKMCMGRNAIDGEAVGFRNEWIWITPTCQRDRCATSDWSGAMHIPIAHGEGRFVTKDPDLIQELQNNDQIAFSYCDAEANVHTDPPYCPNGSTIGIAGICNPAGNVVAMMPHSERTPNGDPFFKSIHQWLERHPIDQSTNADRSVNDATVDVPSREPTGVEIFIDTKIVNNEERTVEQALHRILPSLKLRQLRYLSLSSDSPREVLRTISVFNPNKEYALIRRGNDFFKWNPDAKSEEKIDEQVLNQSSFLRRDDPDTGTNNLIDQSGICYVCSGVDQSDLLKSNVIDIFGNQHASTVELLA